MKQNKVEVPYIDILKTLVGSQARGTAGPDSDWDYRGVFVIPTRYFHTIGKPPKLTKWDEGLKDDTSYEVSKFLELATHCNPTILEVFRGPPERITNGYGDQYLWECRLRDLFPYVWNSQGVFEAHRGYSKNQRTKLLADPSGVRAGKYAQAQLRVLYQGTQLLEGHGYVTNFTDTPIFDTLMAWKNGGGGFSLGDVVDTTMEWESKLEMAYHHNDIRQTNTEAVNEFLWSVRKEFME